jgi:hypothetical protein
MRVAAARHQPLYDDVAIQSGVFVPDALDALCRPPLQQLWLDHLLALVYGRGDPELKAVRFVVCAPEANVARASVVERYAANARDRTSFEPLSLDRLVANLETAHVPAAAELRRRYLPWTVPGYRPGEPAPSE